MNDKTTLVLVIKDRPFFTLRWLSYMDNIKCPYKILIADGGSDESFKERIISKNFKNISFEYHYFGFDKTYQLYLEKIYKALSTVKTPYVILADDDDFFIPSGIEESLIFLDNNEDFSICGGRHGGIFNETFSIYLEGEYTLKDSPYSIEGINNPDCLDRVSEHLKNYASNYYDVHRTEQLTRCFKEVAELNLSDLYLVEIYCQVSSLINGKSKKLNTSYLVRQHNNPTSSARYSSGGGSIGRMLEPNWSKDFTSSMRVLAEKINKKNTNLEFQDLYDKVCSLYKGFLLIQLRKEFQSNKRILSKIFSGLNFKSLRLLCSLIFVNTFSLKVKNSKLTFFSNMHHSTGYKDIVLFLNSYKERDV